MNVPTEIEILPTASLVPYARNARTHSDAQVAQIAGSMREFGWTNPVLIDGQGGIIAGHGRVLAAMKLGITEAPCIRLGHMTDTQRRAYVLADNKLAINGGWDLETLALEVSDLVGAGFDMSVTGFGLEEVEAYLAQANATPKGNTDPDDVPEVTENPVSKLGDVWILGSHRLACGDCTEADVVERVLAGVKPHLMVTDPPYGVEYDPKWRDARLGKSKNRATGAVENDDRADWREAWALFPGDVAYVWHAGIYAGIVGDSLASCDLILRSQIIWAKSHFAIGRGNYHIQHETCWYAVRDGKTSSYNGDRTQSTLWEIQKPQKSETGHATQKPVECMRRPIENNSNPGQAVYEPFSGSGTTIIAAEMLGRSCYAVTAQGVKMLRLSMRCK